MRDVPFHGRLEIWGGGLMMMRNATVPWLVACAALSLHLSEDASFIPRGDG